MLSKPCPLCYTRHAMGTACDNRVGKSIMAAARPKDQHVKAVIQDGPAYRLSVDLTETPYGVDVKFISFVPTARQPAEHIQLQLLLSHTELFALQGAIETVIGRNAQ